MTTNSTVSKLAWWTGFLFTGKIVLEAFILRSATPFVDKMLSYAL